MKQYNVTGMSCAACSARVEKAVNKVPGVTACSVSLLTNSMGVEGTAEPSAIIAAVETAGYGASEKGAENSGAKGSAAAADEFRKISATMRLRGVELSARNLVLHPGRSLEYVLVPLIIRTIKIADDLAASAMTRGLDLVGARTTYRDVRIGASGALVTAAVLVCTAAGYVAWAVNVL